MPVRRQGCMVQGEIAWHRVPFKGKLLAPVPDCTHIPYASLPSLCKMPNHVFISVAVGLTCWLARTLFRSFPHKRACPRQIVVVAYYPPALSVLATRPSETLCRNEGGCLDQMWCKHDGGCPPLVPPRLPSPGRVSPCLPHLACLALHRTRSYGPLANSSVTHVSVLAGPKSRNGQPRMCMPSVGFMMKEFVCELPATDLEERMVEPTDRRGY